MCSFLNEWLRLSWFRFGLDQLMSQQAALLQSISNHLRKPLHMQSTPTQKQNEIIVGAIQNQTNSWLTACQGPLGVAGKNLLPTRTAIIWNRFNYIRLQRLGQDFSRGEGLVTLYQSEATHLIVMPLSPPVLGCLLKKAYKRGGGGGGSRALLLPIKSKLFETRPWLKDIMVR